MANEATLRVSLAVRTGHIDFRSQPTGYNSTVVGAKGPTPGAITVTTAGVDVSFAELTTPGWCQLQNTDESNYVEWGLHDGSLFHPVGELGPGETYVFKFSRNLGEEHVALGTGTTGTVNTFHLKANTASCVVIVNAFEA